MAAVSLAQRVVRWQKQHGRNDLPWQNTRDVYRVWLSEVMLQQTQVASALGYFERFVRRLPTLRDLSAATEDEVLGLWSGLGYYSRARNLHRCAQRVVNLHGGEFPTTAAQLADLPGIGRSTAAAIASICFGERVAILDANAQRVLTRVLGFGDDLALVANERRLWAAAHELLPRRNLLHNMPRFTQGMMDLGATLCLARQPQCSRCPLVADCVAHHQGAQLSFPNKTRTLRRSASVMWLLLARSPDGSLWLRRRPAPGVWGGLYCLPWFDSREELLDVLPKGRRRHTRDIEAFKHVLTHKDLYLHPVQVELPRRLHDPAGGQWFAQQAWQSLGLPAPVRCLLSQLVSQPYDVVG